MKKLIKKSEFYNSFLNIDSTFTCFKNPNSKEWKEVNIIHYYDTKKEESGTYEEKGIRGICFPNGDVYICSAIILHDHMIRDFEVPDGGLHFEGDNKKTIIIRMEYDTYSIEYLQNIFNKTGKFPTKILGYKSPGKKSKFNF